MFGVGFFLLTFIQACAQSPIANDKIPGDLKITLNRTICYGSCPAYSLTIAASGKVAFEGRSFTGTIGKAEGKIDQKAIKELTGEFIKADFFNLKDNYSREKDGCREVWTDHPSETISITVNAKKKTVSHYFGCKNVTGNALQRITKLGERIDELVKSDKWVKGWKPENDK